MNATREHVVALTNATRKTYYLLGRVIAPPVAGLGLLIGIVNITLSLMYVTLPRMLAGQWAQVIWPDIFTPFSSMMLVIAASAAVWSLLALERFSDEPVALSDAMFSRYLIGLGYFLLVTAIVTMIAIVALAQTGFLEAVLRVGAATPPAGSPAAAAVDPAAVQRDNVLQGVLLLMALVMTLLGALFYFANSLWKKFKDPTVLFDRNVFWAGLWFRLSEAIVFTIAVFVFLRYEGKKDLVGFLPMLGLFIGMTVKSSEVLIFGLLERGLAAVSTLVQSAPKPSEPPHPKEGKEKKGVTIGTLPPQTPGAVVTGSGAKDERPADTTHPDKPVH
jgi:hypothetical protein